MLVRQQQLDKPVTSVTAAYTVLVTDYYVLAGGTTDYDVTLPTAVNAAGFQNQEYVVKATGTGRITIQTNGAETIDGLTTYELAQYESVHLASDGTNWTVLTSDIPRRAEVICRNPADLTGSLRSDVTYIIDGSIDMGSTSIQVPTGGLTIAGNGYLLTRLISTAPGATLFVDEVAGSAGDLTLFQLTTYTTDATSQVFNLDSGGSNFAVEMNSVNIGDFGTGGTINCGTIKGYRQFRCSDFALIDVADGLTLDGAMSGGILITETIILAPRAGVTQFKAGGTLVIAQNLRSDINALAATDGTTIIFDHAPANFTSDAGFILDTARFGHTGSVPNTLPTDVKARFKNCTDQGNTYVGSYWELTDGAITSISASNTLFFLNTNTTTYTHNAWFSDNGNNSFVYDSTEPIRVEIKGAIAINGGSNDEAQIVPRLWDDSASTYVDLTGSPVVTLNGNQRGISCPVLAYADMEQNDRIELWVQNLQDTTNIRTTVGGGIISVTELPS